MGNQHKRIKGQQYPKMSRVSQKGIKNYGIPDDTSDRDWDFTTNG